MRVRKGWRICLRMWVSVLVCATWLRRTTASFLSTFIAYTSVPPFLRTSITLPKPPLPSTLSRSKSSMPTLGIPSGMVSLISSPPTGAAGVPLGVEPPLEPACLPLSDAAAASFFEFFLVLVQNAVPAQGCARWASGSI